MSTAWATNSLNSSINIGYLNISLLRLSYVRAILCLDLLKREPDSWELSANFNGLEILTLINFSGWLKTLNRWTHIENLL